MTATTPRSGIFRTKSVEQSIADTDEPDSKLRRDLGALDLTIFGVSVLIGAGIFTITARVAGDITGPSIAISFVIAAIACGFAGLCYAEFASTVPVAGSAYTFSYATFGEFIAWIIGWDLILEYALGAAVVSKAWSSYLGEIFALVGLPERASVELGPLTFDWGAILVIAVLTAVLVAGIKLSSRVSAVVTGIKVLVVLLVIGVGLAYVQAQNYSPFIPPSGGERASEGGLDASLLSLVAGSEGSTFGIYGLLAGASLVFFAFIGFDAVSTTAEETRNPQKDLPRGILGSLGVVTVLYVATSLVVVGMVPYTELATDPATGDTATLATAFSLVGADWASTIISIGAIAGLTTVVLVLMLGQSRVFFAMSRDGLLPRTLARVGSRGTPVKITVIIGTFCAVLAGFFPADELESMVNIGTLFAFVLVAAGTVYLRRARPDLPRSFTVRGLPVVAALAVLSCVWLMINLTVETWIRFVVWMVLGVVIFFVYSRRNSVLGRRERGETGPTPAPTQPQ
ncbi:amino acid permease [Actinomycetospora cinnamomea]|uniref:Amino acid/polyamine/organocation transporter (APC superfamily) n=1 Tax=Actinomycetospora cinnamomea TaxID=663609 RepID=A0A2U1FRV4_9PSEU|nr:amino acid permease [Actinomycetospora cinnamomea]PVZ14896.1 amino acid/polyamine/organocation transporter (APC superfamily) [Actinomycetospora cinnamomea]